MPWNGSGVFTRLFSWQSDAAAGIDITASRMDSDTNNITAVGFSNCLTRDGQGSATGLLPMNGFRHTEASNGVAATDYATVGQLQAPGYPAGTTIIPAGAYLGEIRETSLPEALLSTLMPGWHICGGFQRPRTDPLWLATGGAFPGSWAFGNGDGSGTYTLPDKRGRVGVGRDDMGGFGPVNRITPGVCGIVGTTLGASGGDQRAQADTITTSLSGAVSASSTATSTVTDPTHTHTTQTSNPLTVPLITAGGATNNAVSGTAGVTGASSTGITVATSVTTTTTNSLAATSTSGLTGASQNVQPSIIFNYVIFTGA